MSDLLKNALEALVVEDVLCRETGDFLLDLSREGNKVRSDTLTLTEIKLVATGHKIPAIKEVRARLNLSLLESKHLVEDFTDAMEDYRDLKNEECEE